MRPAFGFKDSSMWACSPEKGWFLFPQSSSSRRNTVMVKVEVEASEWKDIFAPGCKRAAAK